MAPRKRTLTLNAEKRKNEARREANRKAQRLRRANMAVRLAEKERDRTARQKKRQNPAIRAAEQARNTKLRQAKRQSAEVRAVERPRDTKARQRARKNKAVEQLRVRQAKSQEPTEWEEAIPEFEQLLVEPTDRYYSSDSLWFKKELLKNTNSLFLRYLQNSRK